MVKSLAFILVVSFFEFAHSFPLAQVGSFKCPKNIGHFPKPGSCSSFYKCTSWRPQVIECPGNENFFPARGYCVDPEIYPCFDKSKNKECPLPKGKFLKRGTGCKVYYDCCNGEPTEKRCPADQIFDSKKVKCEWPELYNCTEGITVTESIGTDPNFITSIAASSTLSPLTSQSPSSEEVSRISTAIMLSTSNSYKTPSTSFISTDSDSDSSQEEGTKFTENRRPSTSSATHSIQTDDSDSSEEEGTKFTENRRPSTSSATHSIQTDDSDSSEEEGTKVTESRRSTTGFATYSVQTDDSEEEGTKFTESRRSTTGYATYSDQTDYSDSSQEEDTKFTESRRPTTSSASLISISYSTNTEDELTESGLLTAILKNESTSVIITKSSSFEEETETQSLSTFPGTQSESYTETPTIDDGTDELILEQTTSNHNLPSTSEGWMESSVSEDLTFHSLSTDESTVSFGTTMGDGRIGEDPESTTIMLYTTEPVTLNIFCPELDGYFPHPNDKHKFIGCVGGDPRILTCPSNLVYVHKKRACDYESYI